MSDRPAPIELTGGIGQKWGLSGSYPFGHLSIGPDLLRIRGLIYDSTHRRSDCQGLRIGRWFGGRRVHVVRNDGTVGEVYFVVLSRTQIDEAASATGWPILD